MTARRLAPKVLGKRARRLPRVGFPIVPNRTEVSFRLARKDDLGKILALRAEFTNNDPALVSNVQADKEMFERLIGHPSIGQVYLLTLSHRDIGYMVLTFGFSVEHRGRAAFLDEMYVRPGHRGKGITAQCIDMAIATSKKLGVRALHLGVEGANETARKVYRAWGFQDHNRLLMTREITYPTSS
jgi:GNAT superfamily N-acetyltransferase